MTVTCHQPHFLPWLPYWNKLAHSDVFLVMDDVPYRKHYYHNRARIVDHNHNLRWLTVPIAMAHGGIPISQVTVAAATRALRTSVGRLQHCYSEYKEHAAYLEIVSRLETPPKRLLQLNLELLSVVLTTLEMKGPEVVLMSRVRPTGAGSTRILNALRSLGANRVIVGMGKMRQVNDLVAWEEAGITLLQQSGAVGVGESSLKYGAGVSVIHDIFSLGRLRASQLVREFWTPEGGHVRRK